MTIYSLFSGSKGNCTYVRAGRTRILIDAGMSCRAIERALAAVGDSLSSVNAIFITHEHSDHIKALPVLLKKHPIPVHIAEQTAKELEQAGYPTDCFCIHPPIFHVKVAAADHGEQDILDVASFPTPHDSRMSVGYRFSCMTDEGIRTAALATDIGHVTEEIRAGLTGAEDVIIESNHDENMLFMGPYPYDLKLRIRSDRGHLSNADCAEFACDLVGNGTKHLMLAHLSPENNTPDLAYLTVLTALQRNGYTQDEDFTLAVARRDEPVCLVKEQECDEDALGTVV
ncbi:MAG: MBL fold metallo-hydrolase [Clostridia bacterium]|nr:MBL fold metallo-hydrolase [Clostridia bacterium]